MPYYIRIKSEEIFHGPHGKPADHQSRNCGQTPAHLYLYHPLSDRYPPGDIKSNVQKAAQYSKCRRKIIHF